MPAHVRKPSEITQQVVPLLLLGVGLVTTSRALTFIGDESRALDFASLPVRAMLGRYFGANAPFILHPPLFEIFLHFWLRWTGGPFDFLRIPSILFFVAGLFLLGRVSRQFTGPTGGTAVVWIGTLWPFGFHYGRLATWYAWSFFLVCGLTLAYLKYLESRSSSRWTILFLFCLGLIWTNYFGWAILGCLAVDFLLRSRGAEAKGKLKVVGGIAALLVVAFVPFVSSFREALKYSSNFHLRPTGILANLVLSGYSLFTSESVAPWYWWLSVPAILAILLCIVMVVRWAPRPSRRFLFYGISLIILMALIGILDTRRLLMISPWILLPIGVTVETEKPRWATFSHAAALLLISAIGWYGIYARHYYSNLRFSEPWQDVAEQAAQKIRGGATVVADDPSFLLYLTYALPAPARNGPWKFEGLVTSLVSHPQVYSPESWLSSGRTAAGKILLIRGSRDFGESSPISSVEHNLDRACGSISSRLMMRDEGYTWKRRFFPELDEPLWRIEVREYDCESSNSRQIFRVPTP